MTTSTLILLTLQGVIFAVWAFLMFRTLFLLAGRARQKTGKAFPGLLEALRQWREWLTSAEDKRSRHLLGAVTLLLIATSGVFAIFQP